MTPQAPIHIPASPALAPSERPTTPVDAASAEPTLAVLPLLDHRTRKRAILMRHAPRGRYLAFQDGDEVWVLALQDKPTHIGRGLSSNVRLEDAQISRHHAIIVHHGRYARLLDDRSANGTFLNGWRITAKHLRDGDVIRLGRVAMQYIEIG